MRDEPGTLGINADHALEEVTEPDIVLVPGGAGSRPLMEDEEVLSLAPRGRRADQSGRPRSAPARWSSAPPACSRASGRPATGSSSSRCAELGADPVGGRYVEDGKVITAAGVSAGIDMALHLVGRELGPEVAQAVQLGIEYDPQPPFDAGSPQKAPAAIVEAVTAVAGPTDEWVESPL